jgi:hypothetical protein
MFGALNQSIKLKIITFEVPQILKVAKPICISTKFTKTTQKNT